LKLTSLCTIEPGFTARTRLEASAQGVLAIQLRDITPNGALNTEGLVRVDLDSATGRYTVGRGDVVFRARGEWNTAAAIDASLGEPAVAVLPLFILRPDPSIVIPAFLAWSINQPPAQRHFEADARGTNLRIVPKSSLETLELDIPDLSTQQRILTIHQLADQERKLGIELAEKRRKLTSLMLAQHAKKSSPTSEDPGARK
jgi:restriction endonuclease S subunit